MIRTCVICGTQFEGRPNALCCSGPCRLEHKKRYNIAYRDKHYSSIQEGKRKWYAKKMDIQFKPKEEPEVKESEIPKSIKHTPAYTICRSSRWGRRYLRLDRMEQIVALSTELSKLNIARLTYGYLSAIRDNQYNYYLRLLEAVVKEKSL